MSQKRGKVKDPWLKLLKKVELCGSSQASRSRVKEVTITKEDLKEQFSKQGGCCYWFGIPINIDDVYTTNNPLAPSVDRLDNDKDYHKSNIVVCTILANMGRGKCDLRTFEKIVKKIKNFLRDYED
jgi:hypothetical protein